MKLHEALLGAALLAPAAARANPSLPPKPDMQLKLADYSIVTRDYCLPSGLRISFQEDHSQPIVAITAVVDRGSDVDPEGLDGIAHLCEHLWFRSVQDEGHGSTTWDYVQSLGASINAFTTTDETAYMTIAPVSALPELLRFEADRLTSTVKGVTEEVVAAEKEVVRNEMRLRYENTGGQGSYYIAEKLYPEGHPYHHTTMGTHETLDRIRLADVQAFTEANYRPENTTILVVGDFDLDETWDLVVDAFPVELLVADPEHPDAPFEPVACPVRVDPNAPAPEPPDPADRSVAHAKAGVDQTTVLLAWTLPGGWRSNQPLMETTVGLMTYAIATYLRDPDERYDEVDPERLGCFLNPQELASEAQCYVVLRDGEDPDKVIKKAVNGLYQLWDIENRDWQKRLFERSKAFRMADTLETVEEYSSLFSTRATETALFMHFTGDAAYFSRQIEALSKIEAKDAAELAQKYLNRDRYVAVVLEPYDDEDVTLDSSENQFRGRPREPTVTSAYDLSKVDAAFIRERMVPPDLSAMKTLELENGLDVVILPYGNALIARASLLFRAGRLREPHPGLATAAERATELLHKTNGIDLPVAPTYVIGHWSIDSDSAFQEVGISGSAGNLDAQLYLLRVLLEGIDVDERALAGLPGQLSSELRENRQDPAWWARTELYAHLFPDHPMGRFLDEDAVDAIAGYGAADLESWNRAVFQPSNATLFIVGRVDPEQAADWARTYLGSWHPKGGAGPLPDPPPPPDPPQRTILVFDAPHKTQTDVTVACQLAPATLENEMARRMVAAMLDEMDMVALRKSSGVTYGANAFTFDAPGGAALLYQTSAVQNDAAALAVEVFLQNIQRARDGDLDGDLLKVMKLRDAQKYVLGQQTSEQMLHRLMEPVKHGYGWEAITQRPEHLAAVEIPDLQAAVERCAGHEVVTLVGPTSVILPELDAKGFTYEVVDWEAEADRLFKEHDPKGWAREQKRKAKEEKRKKK